MTSLGLDVETDFEASLSTRLSSTQIAGLSPEHLRVRVEEVEEPTMQEIRYLDKLVEELARGKLMEDPAHALRSALSAQRLIKNRRSALCTGGSTY